MVLGTSCVLAGSALPGVPFDGVELLKPSRADRRVTQFDDPNVIIDPVTESGSAPLLIFFSGTGGKPENLLPLLHTAAAQGYRVLGLSYADTPGVTQVCRLDPDPACSLRFRTSRLSSATTPVPTAAEDAIITRLRMALAALAKEHPRVWGEYLTAEGKIMWSRVAVGGFSQGAGMAALIGKLFAVQRVILFSGPWDTAGSNRLPAPWLFQAAATPLDRWHAERHVREKTTDLLAHAYRALGIPEQQVLLFDHDFSVPRKPGDNPAHRSTVNRSDYIAEWKIMFGRP